MKEMGIVMMKITIQIAILMAEIAVGLMSTQNIAKHALVLVMLLVETQIRYQSTALLPGATAISQVRKKF